MAATPRPWTLESVHSEALHEICVGYEIPGAGSPIVLASVNYDDPNDRNPVITLEAANANARLIVQSANSFDALLAACKAAREAMAVHGFDHFCREFLDPAIAQAEKGKS